MPDHTEVIITYQARYFNYNNKIIARKYFAKRYATIILIFRSHKNRPKKQTVNKISVLSICFQQRGKYKKRRALRRRVTIFIAVSIKSLTADNIFLIFFGYGSDAVKSFYRHT